MLKKLICFSMLWPAFAAYAQHKPEGLMTDLMAHADLQLKNGYRVPSVHTKEAFLNNTSVKIKSKRPFFSWAIPGVKAAHATGIEVTGYPDTANVVFDSKVVGESCYYKGKPLEPNKLYRWRVIVGSPRGAYSDYAYFFTDSLLQDYASGQYPLVKTDQLPVRTAQVKDTFRADFGKAAFGRVKLTLTGKRGDSVLVRLGEAILPDGSINRKPGGSIRFQQYTVHLENGKRTYEVKIRPDARNTGPQAIKMPDYIGEVLPFRYCEVEGYKGKPAVVRVAVNYPFDDHASMFESSDPILNEVWEMSRYTMKATSFTGIYVDGDRERIPYEADAYINQLGHYAVDREYTMARRSQEHLLFNATWPTEWILQTVIMAWNDLLYTGDTSFAAHYYEQIKAKLLMPLEGEHHLISTRTGKQNAELMKAIHYNGKELKDIVDWPHTGILGLGKSEGGETDGFVFTDYNAVVNAYYYKALFCMGEMAMRLGRHEDADVLFKRAEQVKESFRQLFIDKERNIYRDGIGTDHASLHANMFAIAFGLERPEERASIMAFIRSRGMACSVYGSQFLMDGVYRLLDGDYGLKLLRSQEERSWYNMIRAGSTIAMEAWDNKYKPNQDWNHAWGAVPANIIPRRLMGVAPLEPGWTVFSVVPLPGDLPWAKARIPTIRGSINIAFKQNEKEFVLQLTVPGGTKAVFKLPYDGPVFVNGKPANLSEGLPEGSYEIRIKKVH